MPEIAVWLDHQLAGKTDAVGVFQTTMPIGSSRIVVAVPQAMSLRSERLETLEVSSTKLHDVVVCLSPS